MKILVTGSDGFVGRETCKQLSKAGHEVSGYDLMDKQDIRNEVQLNEVVCKVDRILHLAAIARFTDADANPMLALETNVIGTRIVAEAAERHCVPLVYASTGSVYMPIERDPPIREDFPGRGNSVYACTKYQGELYVRNCKTPWIVLRYAHLYGTEKRMHGLVGAFLDRIQRGIVPVLYGGQQSNDFTYIADVARANQLALTALWHCWNRIYNIGTGQELTAEMAAEQIGQVFGYSGTPEIQPARSVDPQRFVFDCSLAERFLGYKAQYGFREGLLDMKSRFK